MATVTAGRKSAGLLAIAALAAAALVPIVPAGAQSRAIGWILTRASSAARPIEGTLALTGISSESAVLMFATSGTASHRRLDYRFTTTTAEFGIDGSAQINDAHVPSTPCSAACQDPVGTKETLYVTSNERALTSTVFVAAYDIQDPTLTITSPGWKVRSWQPSWRELTSGDAPGSTMITTAHTSVGTYRGGELTGGRYGSIASAAIPCGLYGQGSATLTGGTRSLRMACDVGWAALDAVPKSTTWRVTGETTGAGWATGVLIVVDYPR